MKPAAVRLALVSLLFVGWLGYLGYLVVTRPRAGGAPLVVSRPQVLTSEVDVVAEVGGEDGEATVKEVLWPEENAPLKEGDRIKIDKLHECRPPSLASVPDYSGPGAYLVPLRARKGGGWEVAPIPASPGFAGSACRIYPATAEALAQYRTVRKPG